MTTWQFWIDRGGTFTDIVARNQDGTILTRKLLSENPGRYQDAAIQGIRDILNLPADQSLEGGMDHVKMGTTVGTNALLECKGDDVALLINRGFKDVLQIAYQNRPDIFALHIELPEPLYQTGLEIPARIASDGRIIKALEPHSLREQLLNLYRQGFRHLAAVFVWEVFWIRPPSRTGTKPT